MDLALPLYHAILQRSCCSLRAAMTVFELGIAERVELVKRFLGLGDPDPSEVARGEGLVRQFGAVLVKFFAVM